MALHLGGFLGSRDTGFHSLVDNSFESPQRNPTRIPSGRSLPLHRLKCCGLGCSHGQKDRLREVVRGHERAAHQCAETECDLAWSPSLRGYSPRLQCCHYVRQCLCHCLSEKSGKHSQQLYCMAIDTCEWAEKRSMTLIPRHLPGHLNVLADHLSRRDQILKTEWSLNPAVARRVFRVWGSPHVDLFALKCNTTLATYMSPIPEPEAWKVDSLVQSWEGMYAYAYPPTALIRQTLNKLILHRAELILIDPFGRNRNGFRTSYDCP